ncbi:MULTISPECIES: NAD-dependent epimerase/dehydratase family protein [unclassified Caballeronia]|uniref:NAD-dependent epimerase/dehydratase family protein n=1 Tax=unclassified Caballeronia TaxID=2646786 RepID=UPI002857F015|nr:MULTISPECIES: NAD-dependent epimerase/dehydratase family protein [unclassified Caballeronia]MDR5772367.1 NAD-dependent epimerase/dehydratase family protein [Caballeronia sp. LZ002]MDR5847801.1 NAD-dependent epimerase/dehydratase family protein [Caballeronia sp. LZ003]
MPRVLLIGGGGFIGRHVAHACLQNGASVRVADVLRPSASTLPADGLAPEAEVVTGDYADAAFLQNVLRDVDVVVHLAHDAMRMNIECDMPKEYERNILPATRLMEACIDAGVKKFIFISSGGTVYGNQPVGVPIVESVPMRPVSLYGTSKLCIEHVASLYFSQRELPALIVRPANAYGSGQVPFRGQGLVPTALASGLSGRQVTIFGDGNAVRDYVHVRDIADAVARLVESGEPGEVYNVGTGAGVSVRELLDEYIAPALAGAGFELDVSYLPPRRADVGYNVLDSGRLAAHTDWKPSITLQAGTQEVLDWLRKQEKAN